MPPWQDCHTFAIPAKGVYERAFMIGLVWGRSAAWSGPDGVRARRRWSGLTPSPACRRNVRMPPGCWNMAWALGHKKPPALGAGRGLWRGPEPGANRVGAATTGGAAELGVGMLRLGGVKNISAALRHYGWKPWEHAVTNRPTPPQLKDSAGFMVRLVETTEEVYSSEMRVAKMRREVLRNEIVQDTLQAVAIS